MMKEIVNCEMNCFTKLFLKYLLRLQIRPCTFFEDHNDYVYISLL